MNAILAENVWSSKRHCGNNNLRSVHCRQTATNYNYNENQRQAVTQDNIETSSSESDIQSL